MTIDREKSCYPTVGQLERKLSQTINTLYKDRLGHRATKVDCHLFDNKIIIISENIITPVEKLLLTAPSSELIHQVRTSLDFLIKTKLEQLIEEITQIPVKSCIHSTAIETDSAVAIVMLAETPQLRRKKSHRQVHRKQSTSIESSSE